MTAEIQNYLAELNDLRSQVKTLLEGLSQETLDWRPLEGEGELATNSLAAIAAHLAGSETFLMKEIIGGQKIQRDRQAEFATKGIGFSVLREKLEAAAKATEQILSSLTEKQLAESRKWRDREVPVRWAILHAIEHIAEHLGQMLLTRQLWLARSGKK